MKISWNEFIFICCQLHEYKYFKICRVTASTKKISFWSYDNEPIILTYPLISARISLYVFSGAWDQGGRGARAPLESRIYRVKFLKIGKISFFLLVRTPWKLLFRKIWSDSNPGMLLWFQYTLPCWSFQDTTMN